MYRYCFLWILLCKCVICEDCVTVDFENRFEDDFNSNTGVCIGLSPWSVKQYSSGDIDSPHTNSTSFITPQAGLISCVTSFKFTITSGGTLEVNAFTMLGSPFDQLTVRVFQSIVGGEDVLIGTAVHIPNSVPDWETISMTIGGLRSSFEGYVIFQSLMLSTNSIIKIDSFRYIGPSSNKDSCVIYEEAQTTTVTPTTTTTVATTKTTTVASTTTTTQPTTTTSTTEALKEDCVTANFEYNFEDDFTNNYGVCVGLSTWNINQYSNVNMESPHPRSASFITPQAGTSCVSSFNFTMAAGGTLEVNVYTLPVSIFDQLTIRVYKVVVGGDDILVNTAFHVSNYVPEWEIIRMIINGNGSFKGYVTFQAWTVSTNPIIRIDSFRYIAPSFDEDLCIIYEEEMSTVEPTTTTVTTEAPNDDCVTVNFENNFEEDFTNNARVCAGFSTWGVKQYSTVNIEGPHPKSTRFITPETGMSCVSSFRFTITAGGTLEVKLFMMPLSPFDQLNVRVFQSVVDGDDILVGTAHHISNTIPVWETISMTINGNGSFEGYVTLQVWSVSTNPIIWIDSFRYIAPSFDKDLCVIYEEDLATTIKPTTTTTTPITTTPEATTTTTTTTPITTTTVATTTTTTTTPITTTTEATTTTTTTTPITTTTKAPDEDCVTVDFESNFENDFTSNDGVCVGLSAWDVRNYSSVNIDSPHLASEKFIVPQSGMSCASSFRFSMTAGGYIEVNLYMIVVSLVDQLSVTVFQTNEGGSDVPIVRVFLNNMLSEFVPGWQTLNMTIDGPAKFDGYVTFHAMSMSADPIIWVDSFRYIGPSSDMDSCVIYKDEEPIIDCVTEHFEYDFEDNFTNNNTECAGLSAWNTKQYLSVVIDSPHPNSTRFITPQLGLSCVSSYKFEITAGGTLEVNVYMMAATIHNQLDVSVFQSSAGGVGAFVGGVSLNHQTTNFVPGWQTMHITIGGSGRFEGYVTFVALRQSPFPLTYVDSFRYIGPSSDKDSCVIYR